MPEITCRYCGAPLEPWQVRGVCESTWCRARHGLDAREYKECPICRDWSWTFAGVIETKEHVCAWCVRDFEPRSTNG